VGCVGSSKKGQQRNLTQIKALRSPQRITTPISQVERPAAQVAHLVAILTVNAEGSGTRAAFAARLQHRDRGRDLDARDQQLGRLQGEVRRPVPARRTTRTLASGTWQPFWPTCRRQWVFVTVPSLTSGMLTLATFAEEEGLCLLLSRARTDAADLVYHFVAAWITATVHSALDAVGLTAAVVAQLSGAGISCDVVAAASTATCASPTTGYNTPSTCANN
jgi:hypothetical protein